MKNIICLFFFILMISIFVGCQAANPIDTQSFTESKIEENVKPEDSSDKQLVEIVAKNLGVPEEANVTYEISEKFFWDAGERYFKNVSFYENGKLVATASVDPVSGELIKNIYMYQN